MSSTNPVLIFLPSVDSTNNYAMAQVHAGLAKHSMAWFANEQYAGKGQRGKEWNSQPGENIAISIALQPGFIEVSNQFRLSAAVALGAFDFFNKYAGDETSIKWPNDIYWRDRKAGGILIENKIIVDSSQLTDDSKIQSTVNRHQSTTNYRWAICGIGININQTIFPEHLPNPVSLKQITGKNWGAFELAAELHQCVLNRFEQLKEDGFQPIYQRYLLHQYKINQLQKFKKNNRVFEAVIKSINPAGQLVLQHSIEECYDFGEIEWVTAKI
ncbi:MAG: biotin--[acetyl-CoA-carboxylase] ligase [Sphingobacteriales bacterium]|nr:MAG: biotin--[acetyl-CoA-carboxylase] ligase [Sphingobacteriales bacterium]